MTKLLIIGLDGATWKIVKPHLSHLLNFKRLLKEAKYKSLFVRDVVLSPAIWCTTFSGKSPKEHGHQKFVVKGKLQTRDDIKVPFVWDILVKDYDIRALQIPLIMPPYNFNCEYQPIGYGVSHDLKEIEEDTEGLTNKTLAILKENPEVLIVVYGALDRLQHFHWGTPLVPAWYQKIDRILGALVPYGEKIIIISDHGFCAQGEARVRTLPLKNNKGEPLKGDHHEEAILITKNISFPIKEHKDIFNAILKEVAS